MHVNRIITGNSLEVLKTIPDNSIDCCITSPPYWGLRDYGHEEQLGSEAHFKDFVNNLCNVFDEVKRVLKPTGTCFVNLGDTYASGIRAKNGADLNTTDPKNTKANRNKMAPNRMGCGLPDKSLCMIPERFAIEMIDRGWILRNQIIWCLDEKTKMFVKFNNKYMHLTIKKLYELKDKGEIKVLSQNLQGENIWVNVKNVYDNGEKESIKITTKTGKEIVCTPEHQFVCKSTVSFKQSFRKLKIKKAIELKKSEYLYSNDELYLDIVEGTREDYKRGFIVGFFLAEGSYCKNWIGVYKDNSLSIAAQKRWGRSELRNKIVGVNFSCGVLDEERKHLEPLKEYDINIYKYDKSLTIRSSDKNLLDLILNFVDGDLCNCKHLKQNAFNETRQFMVGIIDGFVAGDGHLDNNRYKISIKPNYELKDDLLLLCRILGYDFRFFSIRDVKNTKTNKLHKTMSFSIRKNNYRTRNFGCTTDKIEKIETVGLRRVYDIEVEPIYTTFCGKGKTENPTIDQKKQKYNHLYFLGNGIWTHNCKPNQMPQSAKDRFTVDFEKIFFFVKKPTGYYFEQQLEPYTRPLDRWGGNKLEAIGKSTWDEGTKQTTYRTMNMRPNEAGKNMRTVWSINTEPLSEAHFATYPQRLVERMLKAGCPENGIVLDPFFGSGTTGVYARKANRNFLGIELNPEYVKIAENRLFKELGIFR